MTSWWVGEAATGDWWAADERTGMTYRLPAAAGEALWLRGDQERPLKAELERTTASGSTGGLPMVELRFAGVTARYLCAHEDMAVTLAQQFAALVPALRSSPDVVVRLGPEADLDRLHRALPHARSDVWTRWPGEPEWVPASRDLPLIPPVERTSLAQQFVALHAALVVDERCATLVAGPQKSGKTTATLVAEEIGAGTTATDELVLLGRHGVVVGVPLPLRVRSEGGRSPRPLTNVPDVARQQRVATDLVLLEHGHDAPALRLVDDTREALGLLSQHLRPLALSLGDTARRGVELLSETTTWRLSCRPWPDLRTDLETALCRLMERAAA